MRRVKKSEWFKLNSPIGEPEEYYCEDSYLIERLVNEKGEIIWFGINTNWKSADNGETWKKLKDNEFIDCDIPVYEDIIKNDYR